MNSTVKKISSYNSQLLRVVEAVKDIFEDEKEEDEAIFWSRYTPEQRIELEKAFEESYGSDEFISHEDMKKKHEQLGMRIFRVNKNNSVK